LANEDIIVFLVCLGSSIHRHS